MPAGSQVQTKGKFSTKLLVHAAILPKGISELSFMQGGYAINAPVCLNHYL